jgi:Protein of unknown function (DUF692)
LRPTKTACAHGQVQSERFWQPANSNPKLKAYQWSADPNARRAELAQRYRCARYFCVELLVLLDVYNLECDHHNFAADPIRLLDGLDLAAVCEIHVAGGTMHNGYKMDIHSRTVADSTLALLDHVLGRAARVNAVVFG